MSHWDSIAALPLTVDGYDLSGHSLDVSSGFERLTTEFVLRGGAHEGRGEDVTYSAEDQKILQAEGRKLPLAFSGTFGEFSDHVGATDAFPQPPEREDYRNYRRWGIESAALDLALRQSETNLGELLEIEPRPVRFILSLRLGDPPSFKRVEEWLSYAPWLEFKLDAEVSWPRELMEQLAATGRVESIDLKGLYTGTVVDNPADPTLYATVVELFPNAWIEDPAFTDETRPILEPVIDRVTWDAPIHSVADIEALAHEPKCLNLKPSRSGGVQELIAIIEHCGARGIQLYSGGQFELAVGRSHLHVIAGLFFPDSPNDASPIDYHADPKPGVPAAPPAPPPPPPRGPGGPPPRPPADPGRAPPPAAATPPRPSPHPPHEPLGRPNHPHHHTHGLDGHNHPAPTSQVQHRRALPRRTQGHRVEVPLVLLRPAPVPLRQTQSGRSRSPRQLIPQVALEEPTHQAVELNRQPVGVKPAGRSRNRVSGTGYLRHRDLLRDEGRLVALSQRGGRQGAPLHERVPGRQSVVRGATGVPEPDRAPGFWRDGCGMGTWGRVSSARPRGRASAGTRRGPAPFPRRPFRASG
jgi:hypothetical protein